MGDNNWMKIDDWMNTHGDRILRAVYLITDDFHLAEEITQEVFIQAYRQLPSFRGDASPYTWLYKIALNLSRTHVRRRNRFKFLPLLGEEQRADTLEEPVEEKVSQKTTGKEIRKCINQLPQKYKEVILLFYFEDMKISQIAGVLEQPEGTVKSSLARARNTLKAILRKEGLVYDGQGYF